MAHAVASRTVGRPGPARAEPAAKRRAAPGPGVLEPGVLALQQRRQVAELHHSPKAQTQLRWAHALRQSPVLVAQTQTLSRLFKGPAVALLQRERKEVAQRVAPYHGWMASNDAFLGELERDHYALSSYSNLSAVTVTNVHQDPRVIKQLDLADANAVHPRLKERLLDLTSSVHIRPATPTHDNQEGNLPGGHVYYEMGMEGGGGTRLVVDAVTHQIYFSQHYGGRQNMNANGTPKADSPFAELVGMTPAQSAVLRYQVIFFQAETQAYAKALVEQAEIDRKQLDLDRQRSMLATALRRRAAARSPRAVRKAEAKVAGARAEVARVERWLRRSLPEAELAAAAGARADHLETLAAPMRANGGHPVAGFDPVAKIMWDNNTRIGANLRASMHYLSACRVILTGIQQANSV